MPKHKNRDPWSTENLTPEDELDLQTVNDKLTPETPPRDLPPQRPLTEEDAAWEAQIDKILKEPMAPPADERAEKSGLHQHPKVGRAAQPTRGVTGSWAEKADIEPDPKPDTTKPARTVTVNPAQVSATNNLPPLNPKSTTPELDQMQEIMKQDPAVPSATGEPKAEPDPHVAALIDYNKIMKKSLEAYNKTTDDLERREFWEQIMHAAGQLAAGMYGLKTGLDLSGVKFDKTNWLARHERNRAKYAMATAAAKDKHEMTRAELARNEAIQDKIYERNRIERAELRDAEKFNKTIELEERKLALGERELDIKQQEAATRRIAATRKAGPKPVSEYDKARTAKIWAEIAAMQGDKPDPSLGALAKGSVALGEALDDPDGENRAAAITNTLRAENNKTGFMPNSVFDGDPDEVHEKIGFYTSTYSGMLEGANKKFTDQPRSIREAVAKRAARDQYKIEYGDE